MFKELFELVRASGPLTMAVSADAPRGTMTVVVIPKPADAKDEPDSPARSIPVEDGRAVYFGEKSGFYSVKANADEESFQTEFAANLVDPAESHIKPQPELTIGDTRAGELEGFKVGVRHELWAYILLAVIAISTIEWLTYHRRITV